MTRRPVFSPVMNRELKELVRVEQIEFKWHAGFSKSQTQKNIASLHKNAEKQIKLKPILEISTKSPKSLGVSLSAFNLRMKLGEGYSSSVESIFQGSKVFEKGGPYIDLYRTTSKKAKKDIRLKDSGTLIKFSFNGDDWPLDPTTLFYDWLYVTALAKFNKMLARRILHYQAFTDIVFNPKKSLNCQARSAALFVALMAKGLIKETLGSPAAYKEIVKKFSIPKQNSYYKDDLFNLDTHNEHL